MPKSGGCARLCRGGTAPRPEFGAGPRQRSGFRDGFSGGWSTGRIVYHRPRHADGGPVPTVKVATNSALAQRKPQWIDFDAGRLFAGDDLDSMADELYRLVIDVASGRRKTRNEEWGFREIAIFKDGVTL